MAENLSRPGGGKEGGHCRLRGRHAQPYDQPRGLSHIVASRAALADPGRRAAIKDVLTRLNTASLGCRDHPEDYARVISQRTGADIALARQMVKRDLNVVRPLTAAMLETQQLADAQVERGFWKLPIDVKTAFDLTFFTPSPAP